MSLKNNLARNATLVQIVVIVMFMEVASALKCYVCDSDLNSTCTAIKKANTKLRPQNCTVNNQLNTWLAELNAISIMDGSAEGITVPMVCQRVVATKGGSRTTSRFCQLDTKNSDPCQILKAKAGMNPSDNIQIEDCSVCKEDGCNNSSKNQVSIILFGAIASLSMLSKILN